LLGCIIEHDIIDSVKADIWNGIDGFFIF